MLHSENSSQIDIILNKFETDPKFNSSRFGMELLFISEENTDVPMHIDATKSLDDEHTPGIFEVTFLTNIYQVYNLIFGLFYQKKTVIPMQSMKMIYSKYFPLLFTHFPIFLAPSKKISSVSMKTILEANF